MMTADMEFTTLSRNTLERNKRDESLPFAVSGFRTALPQVLATTAKNLLLLQIGMTLAFSTIVIPALQDGVDPYGLTFNIGQASWFGGIAYICQPFGSVLSGIILEPLGRKRAMQLVNIPHLLGWLIFYKAQSTTVMYITYAFMGIGIGFMEAPILTYVGEISAPDLRGILASYAGIFLSIGYLFEFAIGNFFDWRETALISAIIPVATLIAISQVPESPTWLLSKGRNEEARQALQWLRGWVPPHLVVAEYDQLKKHNDATIYRTQEEIKAASPASINGKSRTSYSNEVSLEDEFTKPGLRLNENPFAAEPVSTTEIQPNRKLTFTEKLGDSVRPGMMRPLWLVIVVFFFYYSCGPPGMRPYMIKLFDDMNLPISGKRVTVIMGLIGILGNIACTVCVRHTGKRPLSLISASWSAASIIALGFCALDIHNAPLATSPTNVKWAPFILFCSLWFFCHLGLAQVSWMLTSEVFPNRGRGLVSGVSAACSYIIGFVAAKTYPDLERHFGVHGACFVYGFITIIGYIYLYYCLPETEGKTLAEIESLYTTKRKTTAEKTSTSM